MLLKIIRKFDAAHRLPGYKGKCAKLHGHTYKAVFLLEGKIAKSGMVEDFGRLKKFLDNHLPDHLCLNDILKNPTSENTADYLFCKFKKLLKKRWNIDLKELELWESESSAVCIRGEYTRNA